MPKHHLPFVCFCLLAAPLGSSADELRTLGGKTLVGTLVKVGDQEIVLKTDAGMTATPLSQVLALDIRPGKGLPAGTKYAAVQLLDETVLYCDKVEYLGKEVGLTLVSGAQVKLPMNFVVWVLQGAQDAAVKKKFDEVVARKIRRDRVLILRDGELNPLEGTLGEIDPKAGTIRFDREGVVIPAVLNNLAGMIFFRTEAPTETPICKVHDVQGNALAAVKLAFTGSEYVVTTSFGAKVNLAQEMVSRLDFNLGKLTFLSDLDPLKVVERSGIGLITRYRKDANLDGEPIQLDRTYTKGLSLHAHTELEYQLGGKYKQFKAVLGVDLRTGADSQALVTIWCDGEKRFSEKVSGKARPLALDVRDVNVLKIVVGARNFLDLHDHATLADARVTQ